MTQKKIKQIKMLIARVLMVIISSRAMALIDPSPMTTKHSFTGFSTFLFSKTPSSGNT